MNPIMSLKLTNVHTPDKCGGRGCPIHHPSGHQMATWPLNWRADTRVMERLCTHGIGHPDPDHMAYVMSLTPEHDCPEVQAAYDNECEHPHLEWQGVHSCDGCCIRSADAAIPAGPEPAAWSGPRTGAEGPRNLGGDGDATGVVASMLHDQLCADRPRCARRTGHQQYYRDRASAIIARLEPEIGIANVRLAVSVIIDEMM